MSRRVLRAGHVKWFDPIRKYGFIIPDDGGHDVLFFLSHAKAGGFLSLHSDMEVEFTAAGNRATAVYAVVPQIDGDEVYRDLVTRASELQDVPDPNCRADARLMSMAAAVLLACANSRKEQPR